MYNYDGDTIDKLRLELANALRRIKTLEGDIQILQLKLDAKRWTDGLSKSQEKRVRCQLDSGKF